MFIIRSDQIQTPYNLSKQMTNQTLKNQQRQRVIYISMQIYVKTNVDFTTYTKVIKILRTITFQIEVTYKLQSNINNNSNMITIGYFKINKHAIFGVTFQLYYQRDRSPKKKERKTDLKSFFQRSISKRKFFDVIRQIRQKRFEVTTCKTYGEKTVKTYKIYFFGKYIQHTKNLQFQKIQLLKISNKQKIPASFLYCKL
eukprot:TRINITY_DN3441_c0_g4_i2.p3 TRINITY_DN3441_c0_g4~~TRINITY_DN3441_c0_g4_i2.p3  ORF type:complete len:199 (+),score=-11.94 TRINITY_DN3441_c0_g4_i2:2964-3560(+)